MIFRAVGFVTLIINEFVLGLSPFDKFCVIGKVAAAKYGKE